MPQTFSTTAVPLGMPIPAIYRRAMSCHVHFSANAAIGTCWNGGEFYGPPDYNSLVLLEQYLKKYPEDADKIFLNIKGGVNPKTHQTDGSPENTR
jgi:pyridoxine 4-dehydrogenase